MNKEKDIIASKTVWAGFIGGLATILQMANIVSITPEEQDVITMGILSVIQLIAACGAIYGRLSAKHKIKVNG